MDTIYPIEKIDIDPVEKIDVDPIEKVEILDTVPICKVPPVSRTKKANDKSSSSKPNTSNNNTQVEKSMSPKQIKFHQKEIMYPINTGPKLPQQSILNIPPTLRHNLETQFANRVNQMPPGHRLPTGNIRPFQLTNGALNNNYNDKSNMIKQSSRIRLTIQALEALIQGPEQFHRIDFGDGKGHFFKKATTQDKILYPKGEFFTARVHNDGKFLYF